VLKQVIIRLKEEGKLVCGICGGVFPLVASGILDGKSFAGDLRDYKAHPEMLEQVEYTEAAMMINGNVVTAKDNAEIEFAVKLAELSGFYKSEEEMRQTLAHYKNRDASVITS
jgi:transcriptional regulator GlxA family with amidase domain